MHLKFSDRYVQSLKKKKLLLIKKVKSCKPKKYKKSTRTVLGFDRSDFHLSSFSGVAMALPVNPDHTFP